MRFQENAQDLQHARGRERLKFKVGQRLQFVTYTDDEGSAFKPGDLLLVLPRNGCGMGIDVLRPDGIKDMVWPEEVDLT